MGFRLLLMSNPESDDSRAMVAAWPEMPEGTEIPDNSVVMGVPGKIRAERNNFVANRLNAVLYHENAKAYAVGNYRRWSEPSLLALIAAERQRLADLLRQAEAAAD